MIYSQNIIFGALLALFAEFLFAAMGACVKLLTESISFELVVFYRNFFALLLIAPFAISKDKELFKTRAIKWHLLRSILGVCAMFCFFYAIANIELAYAALLKLTSPLFIPFVAFFLLQEKLPVAIRFATVVGFFGVILVLNPEAGVKAAALIGVLGGLLASIAKVIIRKMSQTEPTLRIVFYFALVGTVISAAILPYSSVSLTVNEIALLGATGAVATLAQLCLTRAYAVSQAGMVGPFTYSSVLFAIIFGWVFWDESITLLALAGALLIIISGIVIIKGQPKNQ
jgi:drug/metabolite transporter (DMT)-like permease